MTGFLGPNGAGKSTTMRMMSGLTVPTKGTATIGGHKYHDIPNPGRHVGVLLDASAQHAGRTGREVLTLGAMTMGLPLRKVDEMLELVSLTPVEAKRRVKNYSLGMRQRLGIAHALIGDPQILILDEPANGLDPAGIHWMRGLLTRLRASAEAPCCCPATSCNEVEMIADDMMVIGHGRIVAQGTKETLLDTSADGPSPSRHRDQRRALGRRSPRHGHIVSNPSGTAVSGPTPHRSRSARLANRERHRPDRAASR